ncbi:MAG TPA: type IV pilus secretin PilQ [Azoarcus taiwanensis]|nr:type IV pilus secretin PilQ [Azoarcus taiwanensis]
MKRQSILALFAATMLFGAYIPFAVAQGGAASEAQVAQNRIENLQVAEQGGSIFIRVTLAEPMDSPPASFSVANPARIAFDFPSTANALGRTQQSIEQGDLRSANIVQAGDRTRLVLNMLRVPPYETRVEGREVIIALNPTAGEATARTQVSQALANFATPTPEFRQDVRAVRDIQFRRGTDGEGRIVVELATPDTGIDIRQQGGNLVVEFLKTSLPDHLQRRSDVTDFGTPVSSMTAQALGENARLLITPTGMWEHNAYQSDTQFVLEVRRLVEDPSRLVQGVRPGEYGGEKLSLNFQNIDVRAVLQVIADFTDFNIVTSDSVTGNLTLRLQDVPWDQALDIILQAKGLDQRKTGNVIWIAPAQELADRERQQLEARAQVGDLEPLITESFQVNYHRASEIVDFLTAREQTVLSARGTVTHDERSNKVFITDVGSRLDAVRRLINEIDIAPRQVLIEARIVEANKDFARDLGVRLSFNNQLSTSVGGGSRVGLGRFEGGALTGDGFRSGGETPVATFSVLNLALFNNSATRFINLELAALESDNRGRVVSSPRVLTANQVEATIEQGTEIAYRTESSAGATTVEFKKAVLSLRVTPQITPDGRVQLRVQVNKDRPIFFPGIQEPGIDTKNVNTEVLVENGGTVVIGGIYEEEETTGVARVPVLGELPVVGGLFRNTRTVSDRKELMVFLTPRIVSDSLTLR